MDELKGKVAIVTGGASGIGKAAVELFTSEGAVVVAADVEDDQGRALVDELCNAGRTATYVHADVSKDDQVAAMMHLALAEYGKLDVLFNNAGIDGETAPTADASLENWDRVIAVNLTGVFLGMKHGIRAMLQHGGGAIINNVSIAGLVGFPGLPAYCAAKGGVVELTRATAMEYAGQGIRALVQVILRRTGLAPWFVPPISVMLARHKSTYLRGLTSFRDGDLDGWLRSFAEATAAAARLARRYLEAVGEVQERWRAMVRATAAPRSDAAAWAIIDALPAHPVITGRIAMAATARSRPAAVAAIDQLAHAGVLRPIGDSGRARTWEAVDLLDLIAEMEEG